MRSNDSPRLREHALILLLQNDGKTYEEIANFIGCGYRIVAHWCEARRMRDSSRQTSRVHGDPDNIETLKDKRQHGIFAGKDSSRKRSQGNYRKATEPYIELLLEVVAKAPQEFGYEFGRWTGERLSTYLEQQTGMRVK